MRTMIQGGDIVAFDGTGHCILQDGCLVFEGQKIVYVGRSYDQEVDRTINAQGKLICPGFINIHALASTSITSLRLDGTMSALRVSEDFAFGRQPSMDLVGTDLGTSSLFAFAGLLKGGSTTIVSITPMAISRWQAPPEQAEVLARTAADLGARAYISHQYRSAVRYWTPNGALHYHWNEQAGHEALRRAVQFTEKYEGTSQGRIRTMLFPFQLDTCSTELLRETKAAARDKNLIIHMHASQSLGEFHEIAQRHGRTPIQYLHDIGFMDTDVILTHVLYTTLNPLTGYPLGDTSDIQLLAQSGTTVAHCPALTGRGVRGEGMLRSFGAYRRVGCNIALGTDTYPMDMVAEMRYAAIMGKAAEQDPLAVTARDVFNAATLSGAKALGRDDLGRLVPGALADIVIVDMTGLHLGQVNDPIKNLVYMASQRDIECVIVDGKVVVEAGRVPGIDEEDLVRKANEVNQRQKMAFVRQNPAGLSSDTLFPPAFPMAGDQFDS